MANAANDVVIVEAKRTAIGAFNGGLSTLSGAKLGAEVIKAVLASTKIKPEEVSEVILGQVLTAAQGMNPARQAVIFAGLPKETTAFGINQVCGSGLRAVALGYQAIKCGDSGIVLAGGQESMSQSVHGVHLRNGIKMGNGTLIDTMINDGLTDIFNNYHMGMTAENIAKQFNISRDDQDDFSAKTQAKAGAAMKAGHFKDEIVPVTIAGRKGDTIVDTDEFPRPETTKESLGALKPAFNKEGSVTAGNASGINDGAAVVVLMSRAEAEKRKLPILARIASWATAGVAPEIMGTGPIPASKAALQKAGWSKDELELVEANEAFAVQAICVNREMGWNESIVNVNGGAVALGHPIGASGARVLTTLLHEMKRRNVHRGLTTLCIGGGMGIAMCVERD